MRNAISIPITENPTFVPAAGPAGGGRGQTTPPPPPETSEQEAATYLFDLLVGARRLAVSRKHRFLAYLIGMAVEEARLLTMGRSASGDQRPAAAAGD